MTKNKKLNENKLQAKIGWKPFDKQQDILKAFDEKRDIRIAAGTRFGKSMLCAYLALRELLKPDRRVWIIAPTYDLSQKIFNQMVKWISKAFPKLANNIIYRPFPQIRNPIGGSFVQCKSAENPTGLLGEELDLAIIDEAARMKNGKEIWEGYIYGRLVSRGGKSIMISTPFGQNWFYHEWLRTKESPDGASFQFTSRDGVSVTEEEWERAKKLLPERIFKQEYEASFLPEAASVFRGVREIVSPNCLRDSIPGRSYVMGVDLAQSEDFTVITVVDKLTHEVVYFDRFKSIEYPLQKQRIKVVANRYNNARVIIDASNIGLPIKEDLEREGLFIEEFKFSGTSKKDLIEKLSITIEQKQLVIPPNETLIDELESFSYELTESGNIKYGAPKGLHDDCVISLALAVWGLPSGVIRKPMSELEQMLSLVDLRPKLKFQSYI